jgi:hypothetical protein
LLFYTKTSELFYIDDVIPDEIYPLKTGPILNGYEAKGIYVKE